MPPPWHFAFVMLLAATPLTTLALALLGVVGAWRGARREGGEGSAGPSFASWSLARLWALSVLVPLLALAIGQTKVYDNERLFMPVFPFLAALSGVGLAWLVRTVAGRMHEGARRGWRRAAAGVVVAAAFAPQLVAGVLLYPHLLSYYSEAVGGLPGAVRLGLETTYWCETYVAALDHINASAPEGAVVWAEDWSHDVLLYYQLHGRLRPDLRVAMAEYAGSILASKGAEGVRADIGDADFAIVAYRETGLAVHPEIRAWIAGREPALRVERFGVPLVEVYRR
jgi:hypothetical protein